MTVLQIIKDLIGKQDINFGDSTTTFTRETHTGGSISMNYIDAECIPSTFLGGYIGDHLHSQNTDTGTTNATFDINSAGNYARLSTSGLSADRTFTFPDTSNQELVGATDLLSIASGLGAATVGVEDTGNYFTGANVEAITQEIGSDIDTLQTTVFDRGFKSGFNLGYSSSTAITISGGMWAHAGTANQHVYAASQITFTLGPGGSNSGSTALGANELHYIYIDDSAVVAAGSAALTASEFLNSTTAPTYSHSKVGWYNSNDRCIGCILTDGANAIVPFYTIGGDYMFYTYFTSEYTTANCPTTYTALDVSSSVPTFTTRCRTLIMSATAGTIYYFSREAHKHTERHTCASNATPLTVDIPLNTSQNVQWYGSGGVSTEVTVTGYYINEL
uniref:Uncharacterized protein n=1 Tax=viral metagenome TaxID=1070528 RepID=A0A6M3J4Q1_9ZZZZ